MASLKQTIYNALVKASTPIPGQEQKVYATPEEARDDFIRLVMNELFPETDVVIPTLDTEMGKRKASQEVNTTEELEKAMEKMEIVEEPPKKKTKQKEDGEKKKPGPKPKEKKEVNVSNTPTFAKKFKAICDELKLEANKKDTLDKLNAMSKEEFNADGKKLEDHLRAILSPPKEEEPAKKNLENGTEFELDGVVYIAELDDEKKPVYQEINGVYKRVGFMGMGKFDRVHISEEEVDE
jgi:hypothetical protein